MFGFLIPRNYIEALEFDKANNNSKWYDATKAELDSIHSYHVFQKHEKAIYDKQKKVINTPPGYQKIRVHILTFSKALYGLNLQEKDGQKLYMIY